MRAQLSDAPSCERFPILPFAEARVIKHPDRPDAPIKGTLNAGGGPCWTSGHEKAPCLWCGSSTTERSPGFDAWHRACMTLEHWCSVHDGKGGFARILSAGDRAAHDDTWEEGRE